MQAPDFALQDQDGRTVRLSDFAGRRLLLYFFPKADTPGCTKQACGLRDNIMRFAEAGIVIVGVSPDESSDLKKFQEKYSLPYTLLGDPSTQTLQAYKVWEQKQFMGRKYMGVLRTSFLIDPAGEIIRRFDDVNPEEHVQLIIGALTHPAARQSAKSRPAARTGAARKPVRKAKPKVQVKPKARVTSKTRARAKTRAKRPAKRTGKRAVRSAPRAARRTKKK